MDFVATFIQQKIGIKDSQRVLRYISVILLLSMSTLLCYFYYNAFAPILSLLASEFGFNDEERDLYLGSQLNSIFFMVGCPCSLIISFVADSISRKIVFLMITFICHISAFLLPYHATYGMLYAWRGLSGALITSCLPIFVSVLSDIFPLSLRSIASVLSSVVVGCGMLAGQTLSGYISSRFGWRFFFKITSTFGILASTALIFTSFPDNGEADGMVDVHTTPQKTPSTPTITEEDVEIALELETHSSKLSNSILQTIFSVPSNWLLFFQGLPGTMPWGVYSIYLHNILCIENHYSIDVASSLILSFGIGAAGGSALAGVLCGILISYNKQLLPVAIGSCYFVSLPLISLLFSIHADGSHGTLLLHGAILLFLGVLLSIPGPCIRTMLINVNMPQCRSVVVAISEVFNNVGRIVGPMVFLYFCKSYNRIDSVFRISEFFYVSAGICFLLYFTCAQDEQAVINSIEQVMQEVNGELEETKCDNSIFDAVDICDEISPDPESASVKRTISLPVLREAGKGVNSVIRKMMDSLKFSESIDTKVETAPLLVKL